MEALLELREVLKKLQWFGEVNRQGFIKITKKLDKKIPGSNAREGYFHAKVESRPFASNSQLLKDINDVNDWLSHLDEAKASDDTVSVHSSASSKRVSLRTTTSLSRNLLDIVDQAIRDDNVPILSEVLLMAQTESQDSAPLPRSVLLNFLQRSISCESKGCIDRLLKDIDTLDEDDDLNQRNCIHRIVISVGRSRTIESQRKSHALSDPILEATKFVAPAESSFKFPPPPPLTPPESDLSLDQSDGAVQILVLLLDKLRPQQRSALQARDAYGRLPLHYAAQYGPAVSCHEIIKHMQEWGQFDVSEGIDASSWQDSQGYTPLHLGVIAGNMFTTKALLEAEDWQRTGDGKLPTQKPSKRLGAVLALATKSIFVSIVRLLIDAGVDINYQDGQGETALHLAARFGHDQCAQVLVEGNEFQKANLEIAEKTSAWTPLFVACNEGFSSIVEQLIVAGANLERLDASGWTAKEHATFRGNLAIARRLAEFTAPPRNNSEYFATQMPTGSGFRDAGLTGAEKDNSRGANKPLRYEKSSSRRYLTNDSMIIVTLGSVDSSKEVKPVELDRIPVAEARLMQLDTPLSIIVTASGASGEATAIDLPVQDNISTDPMAFTTADFNKVKLMFNITSKYSGTNSNIIGRGVAQLASLRTNFSSKRSSLYSNVSVPILAATTLEVIGSVNFSLLVVTPFSHPDMNVSEEREHWKKTPSAMVIGHRGLGKNVSARKSLQLGENTVQSFVAAANFGASYVEFDVQLTKDLVPVIYHDFLVGETGIDAPVHTVTLEQFLHFGGGPGSRRAAADPIPLRRRDSFSAGMSEETSTSGLSERMKHTRALKTQGFKANSRGHTIQAPFTTLEELFKTLPGSLGFNIEIKYPMLSESQGHEMDPYAVELNSFVDTILTKVYDLGGKRNIIFSSFNPEICILLSLKQSSIPVLFLTVAGLAPVGDIRAESLKEAIRFAGRWSLLGVVSVTDPLVLCPRLIKVVQESGLACVTYGVQNNDLENVKVSYRAFQFN